MCMKARPPQRCDNVPSVTQLASGRGQPGTLFTMSPARPSCSLSRTLNHPPNRSTLTILRQRASVQDPSPREPAMSQQLPLAKAGAVHASGLLPASFPAHYCTVGCCSFPCMYAWSHHHTQLNSKQRAEATGLGVLVTAQRPKRALPDPESRVPFAHAQYL